MEIYELVERLYTLVQQRPWLGHVADGVDFSMDLSMV